MTEEDRGPGSASPKGLPRKVFLVSHTHWDREWYLTAGRFRVNLARIVRQVLDQLDSEPEFRHFVLDGQTLALEDYLEVHPEDCNRIRALVEAGRLSLGPWYILPDEFLVSGEATVRNLQIGHRTATRFGAVQKVGYMPDSFGHIAQMPQILRGAGIDSFIYTRGNGDEIDDLGLEYMWCAPDGSEVLAVNQAGGYCNAGGLGFQEIWHAHTRRRVDAERVLEQVHELFVTMAERSNGDIWLLNNGCDHFPPQQDFTKVLAALRGEFPEVEFIHGSFTDFIDAVRNAGLARKTFSGELCSGKLHHILSGVWSARMYLKQQNNACQNLLSGQLEPFCTYAHFVANRPYPAGQIEQAWKRLLRNHPHDSICGCSIDEVHKGMESRFAGVLDTGRELLLERIKGLTPLFARDEKDDDQTVITVVNPLPQPRDEVVERMVVLTPGMQTENLRLISESGLEIPFEVIDRIFVERFWGIDYRAQLDYADQRRQLQVYLDEFGPRFLRSEAEAEKSDCYLSIRFPARDLPSLGHANYFLVVADEDAGPTPEAPRSVISSDNTLENEFLSVTLYADGTFDVLDRETGRCFEALNRLEDSGDVGDEYDYAPAPEADNLCSEICRGEVHTVVEGGLRGRLEVEFIVRLPEAATRDRQTREERLVDCDVRVAVELKAGSRLVEVETRFDNVAEDHRLRAEFPSGIVSEEVISDGHFHLNRRPVARTPDPDWAQPNPATIPQQDFSLVQDGEAGLAVLNRGLPEVEAIAGEAGEVTLSLTLLRAVGWLSRDDFAGRHRNNAGPTLHTPQAQCPGVGMYRYAVMPYSGDHLQARVKAHSQGFQVPVFSVQGVEDGHFSGGLSLLQQASNRTCITAVRKHDERDGIVVRLFNLSDMDVEETLVFGLPLQAAWRLDLLDQQCGHLCLDGAAAVKIPMKPYEIVTVEAEPAERVRD